MKLPPNLYFHAIQIANTLGLSDVPSELKKLRDGYHFKSKDEMILLIGNIDHLVHDLKLDTKEIKNESTSDLMSKFSPAFAKLKETSQERLVTLATNTESLIRDLLDSKAVSSEYSKLLSEFKSAIGQLNHPVIIDENTFSEVHKLFDLYQFKFAINILASRMKKREIASEKNLICIEIGELLKEKCLALLEKEYKPFGLTYSVPYNKLFNFIDLIFNINTLDAFFVEFPASKIDNIKTGIIYFIQLHLVTLDIMLLKARASEKDEAKAPTSSPDIVKRDCDILIDILTDEKHYPKEPTVFLEFLRTQVKTLSLSSSLPEKWKKSDTVTSPECQEVNDILLKYLNKEIIVSSQIFNLVAFYDAHSEVVFQQERFRLAEARNIIDQYSTNKFTAVQRVGEDHFQSVLKILEANSSLFGDLNAKKNKKGEPYNGVSPFIDRLKSLPLLPSKSSQSVTGQASSESKTGYYAGLTSVQREFKEDAPEDEVQKQTAQMLAKLIPNCILRPTKLKTSGTPESSLPSSTVTEGASPPPPPPLFPITKRTNTPSTIQMRPTITSSSNSQNSSLFSPSLLIPAFGMGRIQLKKITPLPAPNSKEKEGESSTTLTAMQQVKLREQELLLEQREHEKLKRRSKSVIMSIQALSSSSTTSSKSDLVAVSLLTSHSSSTLSSNPSSVSEESSNSSSSSTTSSSSY